MVKRDATQGCTRLKAGLGLERPFPRTPEVHPHGWQVGTSCWLLSAELPECPHSGVCARVCVLTVGYVPVCVSAQWGVCPHSGVCARVCGRTVGYVPVCVPSQWGMCPCVCPYNLVACFLQREQSDRNRGRNFKPFHFLSLHSAAF